MVLHQIKKQQIKLPGKLKLQHSERIKKECNQLSCGKNKTNFMWFIFKCYSKYNHDLVIFASALNNWYMKCNNNRFKTIQNASQRVYMQQRGKEAKEPDYRF